jgi:hypothetical protein
MLGEEGEENVKSNARTYTFLTWKSSEAKRDVDFTDSRRQ